MGKMEVISLCESLWIVDVWCGAVFRCDLGVVFRVLGFADFLGVCQIQVPGVPVPPGSQTPGWSGTRCGHITLRLHQSASETTTTTMQFFGRLLTRPLTSQRQVCPHRHAPCLARQWIHVLRRYLALGRISHNFHVKVVFRS